MHTFQFVRPADSAAAVATAAQAKTAQQGADVRFVAGGTTLLDLMKLRVETPARVIDLNRLPLDKIETTREGGLKIGATVRIQTSLTIQASNEIMPCCRRRFSPARRPNSATWRPRPAIFCSARGACTSATPPCRATNASPERMPGDHRRQSHARSSGHERTLHRNQSVRHVRRDGSIGSDHPRAGNERCARDPHR